MSHFSPLLFELYLLVYFTSHFKNFKIKILGLNILGKILANIYNTMTNLDKKNNSLKIPTCGPTKLLLYAALHQLISGTKKLNKTKIFQRTKQMDNSHLGKSPPDNSHLGQLPLGQLPCEQFPPRTIVPGTIPLDNFHLGLLYCPQIITPQNYCLKQ